MLCNSATFTTTCKWLNIRKISCGQFLNYPNPSSVYIRLITYRKKVFYCYDKLTFSRKFPKLFVTALIKQGFRYFARSRSSEIHKNAKNTAKFGRNLIKFMSVQHIWNLFQLQGLFTCRKLAKLSWNFVTETCKQRPKTTRRKLCCEKLGTSHDVKSFAIGSFLERIVVERANDDLC